MKGEYADLGSVARFINGAAFKPGDWTREGLRIIRIQNLTDPSRTYNRTTRRVPDQLRVQPGDLLVSWSATLGVYEWNDPDEAVLNQHIFRVVPDGRRIDKRYLRHSLEKALLDMRRHLHGATMQHVNRGEFLSTKVFVPSLSEQRRIADALDKADALRAKRRATLALLDSLTSAVFVEMFGDPFANHRSWPTATVGGCALQVTDGEHLTPRRSAAGIKLLSARNIRHGRIDVTDVDYVDVVEYERISRRCNPVVGDVLISCSGTIGRVAIVETQEPLALVRSVALVRPNPSHLNSKFLEHYLRTTALQSHMRSRANASSQANLFQNQIRALPLFLPPLALQAEFAGRVAAVKAHSNNLSASLGKLDELFGSLQDRAFNGEL